MVQHRLQPFYIWQPAARLETLGQLMQQQTPVSKECNGALGAYNELKRSLGALSIDSTFTDYKECLHTWHINTYTRASRFRHLDLELNPALTASCHYEFLTSALARIIPGLNHPVKMAEYIHMLLPQYQHLELKRRKRQYQEQWQVLLRAVAMVQRWPFPLGGAAEVRM